MRHDTSRMDVVYLCKHGPNEELRYSLRSLANLPHQRVYIIGGAPSWFRGNIIRTPKARGKHAVTNHSMRLACESAHISDPFILFNDDFYITEPLRFLNDYHRGEIDGVIDAYTRQGIKSRYVQGMARARDTLQSLRLGTKSYELHIPMVIHKAPMLEALDIGGQRRTIYGNLARIGGYKMRDVKVYNPHQELPTGPFLSSDDRSFRHLLPHLDALFPDKSHHERVRPVLNRRSQELATARRRLEEARAATQGGTETHRGR